MFANVYLIRDRMMGMTIVDNISISTYESRNKLHGRGAHMMLIGIPSVC